MKTKITITAAFLLLAAAGAIHAGVAEDGRLILQKADARFYPSEGSYDISINGEDLSGNMHEIHLQAYKSGLIKQTVVWTYPAINLNDVGVRSGDTIYYKPREWHQAEIMSYQSVFADTGFSWGDILSANLAENYTVKSLSQVEEEGRQAYLMTLNPRMSGLYARIDVWIARDNYDTLKRVYYTASGEVLKVAVFRNVKVSGGQVTGYEVYMDNKFYELTSTAVISGIRQESLPGFLFDAQNIGRIHARQ